MPQQLGVAAERLDRLDDVELAVRAGEGDDADAGGHQAVSTTVDRDVGGLDHRVDEEPLAHLVGVGAGAGLVGGLELEADGLADPDPADAVEAEVRERPLDGGALRVGDARAGGGSRRAPRRA